MSDLRFDPESMRALAGQHEEAATLLSSRLDGVPRNVDGGIASDGVAAMMTHVGNLIDALHRVHGSLGLSVEAVADDVDANEDEIIAQLAPLARELDEQ